MLSQSLMDSGIKLTRFKTGTPARINRRSVDFSKMIEQKGDDNIVPFSFMSENIDRDQISCYLTYSGDETKKVVLENIDRSPLYNGSIKSVGPRYCPSFEDKIMRFPEKDKHQIFIEPEGENTEEMYVGGMSSSLPEDVQLKMLRSVPGLENAEMMRTAYAIEYDCIDPTQLELSLEFKEIDGLFSAGQMNGRDRKSTRLNSSHANISYAVFCLKKKKNINASIILQQHPNEPSPSPCSSIHNISREPTLHPHNIMTHCVKHPESTEHHEHTI